MCENVDVDVEVVRWVSMELAMRATEVLGVTTKG